MFTNKYLTFLIKMLKIILLKNTEKIRYLVYNATFI